MKPLTRAKRAARNRTTAEKEYRDAVSAAVAAGHSLREVGAAIGITHVGVLKIVRRS